MRLKLWLVARPILSSGIVSHSSHGPMPASYSRSLYCGSLKPAHMILSDWSSGE